MAALTVQTILQSGLEPAALAAAAGGGDTFADDGSQRTFFDVNNGSGGDITVTFNYQLAAQNLPGYGSIAPSDRAVVVTAGERRIIGPFGRGFISAAGVVEVSYSGVTTLTVGAFSLPKADV